MSLRLLLILSGLLAGCATGGGDALPTCDGHDRRPANPHGSVLLSSQSATPVTSDPIAPPSGGCA